MNDDLTPGFHKPEPPDLDDSIRYFGLRRTASGAFEFKPPPVRSHTIPKRERENIAACAAAGLSYWSEAPGVNRLWAVDDQQQAHEVTIDRRRGTVRFENRECHVETAAWSAAARDMNGYEIVYLNRSDIEISVLVAAPSEAAAVDALWEARKVPPERVRFIRSSDPGFGVIIVYGEGRTQ